VHAIVRFKDPAGQIVSGGITIGGAQGGFGTGPWQAPFFDLSAQVPAGGWVPGAELGFTLSFRRDRALVVTYHLEFAGVLNRDPLVDPGGPYSGSVDEAIAFTATATDPDGHPLTFEWNFGDGSTASTAEAEHAFGTPGIHHLLLTVRDDHGAAVERDVVATVVPAGDFALARTRVGRRRSWPPARGGGGRGERAGRRSVADGGGVGVFVAGDDAG
jgi:hypothetical protein